VQRTTGLGAWAQVRCAVQVQVSGWVSQGVLAKQAMGFTIPTDEIAYDCAGFLI